MRLKSFQVRLFRNVIDSGPIDVADSTCIAAKNARIVWAMLAKESDFVPVN